MTDKENPCKCVDCGGQEPKHSNDCAYMAELHTPIPENSVAMQYLKEKQDATMKQFHEHYTEDSN